MLTRMMPTLLSTGTLVGGVIRGQTPMRAFSPRQRKLSKKYFVFFIFAELRQRLTEKQMVCSSSL
jgi:hypothetical protein